MTDLAGIGLCAEMPSAEPNPAQVTYTPIIPRNPAQAPAESPPKSVAAQPQAPDPRQVVRPLGNAVIPGAPGKARTDQAGSLLLNDQTSTARIMFDLGLGSPVGLIGGTLTFLPWPQFEAELGMGLGISGVQFSVMPKLSVGSAERHFVLGIGPSVGIGKNANPSRLCVSYWLHAEVGFETRSRSGASFLLAFGVVRGLGGEMPGYGVIGVTEQGEAVGPEPISDLPPLLPEFRIAWGHWF